MVDAVAALQGLVESTRGESAWKCRVIGYSAEGRGGVLRAVLITAMLMHTEMLTALSATAASSISNPALPPIRST